MHPCRIPKGADWPDQRIARLGAGLQTGGIIAANPGKLGPTGKRLSLIRRAVGRQRLTIGTSLNLGSAFASGCSLTQQSQSAAPLVYGEVLRRRLSQDLRRS